jgi:hypothetical protein
MNLACDYTYCAWGRLDVPSVATRQHFTYIVRRSEMAKGQMRSNREQKKPKKDQTKPATPALPFGGAQGKSSIPTPVKK